MNLPQNQSKLKKLLSSGYACLFPLILYIILELLNTTDLIPSIPDILGNLPVVGFSALALALIMGMIFTLTGRLFASGFATTAIAAFFYTVSYYRKLLTGWVFVPADLNLTANLQNIVGFATLNITWVLLATAALAVFSLVPLFFASRHVKVGARPRIIGFCALLSAALFLFGTGFSRREVMPRVGLDYRMKYTVNQLYQKSGVLMGFYLSYFYTDITPPDYNESYVLELISEVEDNAPAREAEAVQPNIIVIMSEAFSDPTLWDNITYSSDPIPTFHALARNYTTGRLVSPAFGGSTCNPEYEFLTGNAMLYAGHGVMPFEQLERFFPGEDMRSLPNMLRQSGYATVGVHPYEGDFFSRNTIYPLLGFDDFISMEDMEDPTYKGEFISDEYFVDQIIEVIDSTEEPLFLYGISMENHYGYGAGKFNSLNVTSESLLLTEDQLAYVDNYVQGVYDADKSLARLIEYVEERGEPTIILFFGDHMPLVGSEAFEIYSALEYISGSDSLDWSTEDYFKMFTTSYVLWNNYTDEDDAWGDVSPYFLGALLAEKAGADLNLYYEFLLQAYEEYHGYKENLFVAADDGLSSVPLTDAETRMTDIFNILQYDKTYGGYYARDYMEKIRQ